MGHNLERVQSGNLVQPVSVKEALDSEEFYSLKQACEMRLMAFMISQELQTDGTELSPTELPNSNVSSWINNYGKSFATVFKGVIADKGLLERISIDRLTTDDLMTFKIRVEEKAEEQKNKHEKPTLH